MRKLISLFVVAAVLLTAVVPCFAKEENYPFVFVHGMMGWNDDSVMASTPMGPYWGGSEEGNVIPYLQQRGYEVYTPAISGIGSAWDRACELYAQLTGTVVDYGEAHSAQCGHERYGRDYTGKGMLAEDWYETTKINLLGHSFGGPTVRVFSSLMAYGDETEIAASGEDCSPLFKGGYNCTYSVTTLSGVHNGTIVSNYANDLVIPLYCIALMMNFMGLNGTGMMDPILDHWGLSVEPNSGEKASINFAAIKRFAKSNDHCGYDMTLRGAAQLNERFKIDTRAYHFSYSVRATSTKLGLEMPKAGLFPIFYLTVGLISGSAGMTVDGVKLDKEWTVSDGIVPLKSALYPLGDPHADYVQGSALETGKWYVMPTMVGLDHFDFCAANDKDGFGSIENYFAFYKGLIDMVYATDKA